MVASYLMKLKMAKWIKDNGEFETLNDVPLSLTDLQNAVGGFIRFINLKSDEILVINESSPEYGQLNKHASLLANQSIYGHVVLLEPWEIA